MPSALSTYNLADVWEATAAHVADRTAIICGDRSVRYDELDRRANRLAHWLLAQGVRPGQHIGVYLVGGPEYFETMLAAYKVRAVPINVNYRYVADELRYLFDDADLVGVVFARQFAPRVEEIRSQLPGIGWWLAVEEDTGGAEVAEPVSVEGELTYEDALAASSPETDFGPRSNDDPYIIYTGGTTGMPKGVVWRHEDAFFACIGGGDPLRLMGPVSDPSQVTDRVIDGTFVFLPAAPLMHAAGQWVSLSYLFAGGTVVLLPGSLDPRRVWEAIQTHKVNLLTVVGDPVVRPLLDAWDEFGPFDVSSLYSIGSGGAPLSSMLKARLAELFPNVIIADGYGSSETGAQGGQRLLPGEQPTDRTRFTAYNDKTNVMDETTGAPVEPGSGQVGRIALRGHIPLAYYKDPEKTAQTFLEWGGDRWILTGDMATVNEDGSINLLGRGSVCINTGGEKVFPEEVEGVLKTHPAVYDALVVGATDDRWGERVVGVVQLVPGAAATEEDLQDHCREHVAGYKVPKQVAFVEKVQRSPAGKADYRWARSVAEEAGS
ncbi:MAG: acyl-CoA synthetase [Acidimicrobiales bacterium]|jgi:acyl-CoA synthetase (AMP-forming)/AMP-acid ligase II|nr:acyl-CoA synthetase [Acidimicrobiales bacterium]